MDFFLIPGPEFASILKHYVDLTGYPRLPSKSMFGLQLSDKGHDHNSETPSDEAWWKSKIFEHREAGFPLDHVVNDNRWRAGGGKRCESFIDWDPERYPDPAAYKVWLDEMGLTSTLDFNRCIGEYSEGWTPDFNIPETETIDFNRSAPDLTNEAFRNWFWNLFYTKSLDPSLHYPGDALWIDEFDEMGSAPKDMILSNGLSSAEMRNYWFFLIAKALVRDGWDKSDIEKRPYVWVRGMTAGAQRFGTLWSGDIQPSYEDMENQIRGMQLAGMSAFPYWGHDAGGFFNWDDRVGPDEDIYRKWSMAMGSFSPIWKPHGMGQSRWPMDRTQDSQVAAKKFGELRYALFPYFYSFAHLARINGTPIAKAMVYEHQTVPEAWKHDLQYYWGESLLVVPITHPKGSVEFWLPEGMWYDYWDSTPVMGDRVFELTTDREILLYARAGAIVPKVAPALSTAFINDAHLILYVFTGADGAFTLYEDDGVTELFRDKGALRTTLISYDDGKKELIFSGARGIYQGAPESRSYELVFIGNDSVSKVEVEGESVPFEEDEDKITIELSARNVMDSFSVILHN
jgi:alpha-glucosidase (family GH31 glycosyl hydrolase)